MFIHCDARIIKDVEEFRLHHYEVKNCYEIFEVESDVKPDKMQLLYRSKSIYYKLDGWPQEIKDELREEFKLVTGCYHILSNAVKKNLYDKSRYNYEYAINPRMHEILYYTAKNKLSPWISPITNWIQEKLNLLSRGKMRFGGKPKTKEEI